MTIIFQRGGEFWIERVSILVGLVDAAGQIQSAVTNLERPGRLVSISVTPRNIQDADNFQVIGCWRAINQGLNIISFGEVITGVAVELQKTVGTSGAANMAFEVLLFLRKAGT